MGKEIKAQFSVIEASKPIHKNPVTEFSTKRKIKPWKSHYNLSQKSNLHAILYLNKMLVNSHFFHSFNPSL